MDRERTTVYAYFGSYDAKSYSPSSETRIKTFRFLDGNGAYLQKISTIKPYAFAGVKFDRIELPSTIQTLGDYVFYNSNISYCYTSALDWELTSNTFRQAGSDFKVLIYSNTTGFEGFIRELHEKYGVDAETYSNPILP